MIDPKTRIGHVHLTVSDLDRALRFYRDVLGFEVTTTYGRDAVFLAAGGYHHHIGLNTWAGRGAPRPAPGTTGLYHFAILYPDRRASGRARPTGRSPCERSRWISRSCCPKQIDREREDRERYSLLHVSYRLRFTNRLSETFTACTGCGEDFSPRGIIPGRFASS